MAFVSGGSGGGLPPQAPQPSAGTQLPGINSQILETLILQQQQQQANNQGNVVALLAQALLGQNGNQLGALGAQALAPQQPAQNLILQQLQSQLALSSLLGQNTAALTNPLLTSGALNNPTLALYYAQLLQQQQQQQTSSLNLIQQLQQAQQAQPQPVQAAPPAPAPIPTQASLTHQIQAQVAHSAFQPPTAQAVPSSGNVESHLNAQQKLIDLFSQDQQAAAQKEMEQRLLAAQAASTTASTSIPQPDRTVPRNTKEVHDRIDKLISENAAILQPQEPLLKRRPYHRAVGQQSSMDDSNSSSTRTSPGLPGQRDPRMLANNNRTQSLYEPINGVRAFGGGSLTSGQPVVRTQVHQSQYHTPPCPYCNVHFPNEAGLQCHELRCSKRIEMEKAKEQAVSEIPLLQEATKQHPLKRRLLAAAMQDDLPSPSQKLARKDSGDIIIVTDRPQDGLLRKDSLVPVNTANNVMGFDQAFGHPGLPRRATIAAIPTIAAAAQPQAPAPLVIPQPQAPPQVLQVQSQIPGPSSLQPSAMISPTQHPTAFHQVIQGQNRVNAAALSALQQQQLAQQVYQLQQAQQIPSTSAIHPPQPVIQIQKMEEEPLHQPFNINRLFPLDGNTSKPYTLVLNDAKVSSPERTNRTRNRNITSETFVCLQRAQPMFVEQKGNLSMYSNWHQVTVNEADAKLNLAFMAQCSARPKTGHYPYWKYTVANRDMVQYKVTHSSFWEISQRQQLRLKQQQEMPEIKEEEPEIKQEEKENIDIPPLPPMPPIPPMPQKSDLMPSPSFPESAPVSKELSKTDSTSLNARKDDDGFEWKPNRSPRPSKKAEPLIGGHRTDELYVYVRGRGRGRYVCDRCGIRCKKPSMLKKHIKSHTDIRPYKCKQCNFSFKTKGNLTKHLSSKTHKRRIQAGEDDSDGDDDGRLEIAENDEEDKDEMVEVPDRLDEDEESEDEEAPLPADLEEKPFRRFGQENILLERGAHTPPSRWVLEKEDEEEIYSWPEATWHRSCMSAPAVAVAGPLVLDAKKTAGTPSTPPLPITAMQFVQIESSLTSTASPILSSNGLLAPQARLNGNVAGGNGSYVVNFFPKEEALKCDLCDKTFRKACDLNYHQLTHNVEKQQMINKNRMFQCPECRIPARTKAMLSKHMEQAHGSHIDESAMAAIDPSATTQSVLGGGVSSQMVNNPRSFMCLDCNIGFRKHGILAKHLRSKTHVTKLETLKRLPEDSLSLIQGHDNGACLNEVDTTDCEKARQSLTAIVENIRTRRQEALSSAGSTPATSSSAISLECRETLAASPMPLNKSLLQDSPSNGILRSSYSETSSPFRSRCGSAASTSTDIPRKRSDSLVNKIDQNTLQAMKFISANVWVPPKAQDPSHHRPESIALRAPVPSIMSEAMEVDNHSSCPSPVMRILAANGHKSPPIPPGTRCSVCQGNFDTPVDLQVHLYTDHISVKDGTFFRCPKKLCEKVYPNKESLRIHVAAHYKLESLEKGIEHEEIVSNGACPSVRHEEHEASTPMTDGSDSSCHSPPAEPIRPIAVEPVVTGIPCMTCGKSFPDLNTLQQHWLSHVTNRGHVCQICDAGFTTQEQLVLHQATHLNQSTNGVI